MHTTHRRLKLKRTSITLTIPLSRRLMHVLAIQHRHIRLTRRRSRRIVAYPGYQRTGYITACLRGRRRRRRRRRRRQRQRLARNNRRRSVLLDIHVGVDVARGLIIIIGGSSWRCRGRRFICCAGDGVKTTSLSTPVVKPYENGEDSDGCDDGDGDTSFGAWGERVCGVCAGEGAVEDVAVVVVFGGGESFAV